jgi:hypothetical protein
VSGTVPDPVPHLRRGPDPTPTSGRKVLVGVFVFFLLLVGFVLTLVFTIGLHNNGVRPPPRDVLPSSSRPIAAAAGISPRFFVVDADTGANAYVSEHATYRSQRHHQRAVAAGATGNGRKAYFAIPLAGCRTEIESVSYLPHFRHVGLVRSADDIAVVNGRVQPVPLQVSPDGTKLALVTAVRSAKSSKCTATTTTVVYDLKTHRARLAGAVVAGEPTSLVWEPDSTSFDLLAGGLVTRQVLACHGCVPPLIARLPYTEVLLYWHGQLATVVDGAIRAIDSAGLGATLATGLPHNVRTVSVDPTGTRLLVSADPENVDDPGHITYWTTYEWSAGKSTEVRSGHWVDPSW